MVRHVLKAPLHCGECSRLLVVAAALAISAPGCSASDDEKKTPATTPEPTPPDETNPVTDAYAALESADYAALPLVIDRLDAAFQARPDQGRIAFYAGVMRLWRSVDRTNTGGEGVSDVLGALEHLRKAREVRADDPHVNAFLGITTTVFGATAGNEEGIAEGRQLLRDSVAQYPAYVNGVMAQALGALPREHAYFPEALEAAEASLGACGPNDVSGDAFDVSYPAPGSNPPGACWNESVVKHVWEGIFLIYGDIAAKAGNARRAKQFYGAARKSPTYDDWPYAPELEARLASADERTALYQDADAANDPLIWVQEEHLCVGCHAFRR